MAEVGVLELTIQDNSEEAAKGLGQLSNKLKSVSTNAGSFNLSPVTKQIKQMVDSVKESNKTVAGLGTLLNSITSYYKAVGKLNDAKINTKPIEEIRKAIGSGIKIGNAGSQLSQLRDALDKEWNTEGAFAAGTALSAIANGAKAVAGVSLATVANNLNKVSKALEAYATASEHVKAALGGTKAQTTSMLGPEATGATKDAGRLLPTNMQFFGRKSGKGKGTAENVEQLKMNLDDLFAAIEEQSGSITSAYGNMVNSIGRFGYAFTEPLKSMPKAIKGASSEMQTLVDATGRFGHAANIAVPRLRDISTEGTAIAGNARQAERAIARLLDRLNEVKKDKGFADRFNASLFIGKQVPSAEESAMAFMEADEIEQVTVSLQEMGDTITSVVIPAFREMYQIWSQMAYEFGMFAHESARLMSGSSPLLLGDGKTPGQLLLGDGQEAENMLGTWVDYGQQFATNWVYFVSDVADQWRAMWSPDWILGGWNAPASMSSFALGSGMMPLLLGSGGVSPENMLSTWVDDSEQWKPDWTDGSEWEPDWVEGTVDGVKVAAHVVGDAVRGAAEEVRQSDADFFQALQDNAGRAAEAERIRAAQEEAFYATTPVLSMEQTNAMADNLTQLDLLKSQLREAEIQYNKFVNELGAGDSKTIKAGLNVQSLRDKIWEYTEALREANEEQARTPGLSDRLAGAFGELKTGVSNLIKPVTSLTSRFLGMMKMRAMRYVIRQLASGFSEGVQNVYNYSKAVGTSLAPTMDQAATAMQQLKNSIGAAVSPLIQALVPAIQSVIDVLITGINYFNQFFALLNGQNTWTRALPEAAEAFEKNKKAAKDNSKAVKDLLADWDELNIIQSNSNNKGSTGTGKTAEEYKNMFEEVSEFSDGVRDVVNFIEEHMGGLPELFKKIGAAILGWKISKAFSGVLGQIGKLVAGGALLVLGVELAYGGGFEAGKKGFFDSKDLLASIGGTLSAAIGGSMISSALGLGHGIGLAIGLGVGVVATLTGWIEGQADLFDSMRWGNKVLTPAQIKDLIKSMFSFNIESEITVLDSNIKNREQAKTDLETEVNTFTSNLNLAKIKVGIQADDAETAVSDAYTSAQNALKKVQDYIDVNHDALITTFSIVAPKDSEGNDITEDIVSKLTIGEKSLKQYFTEMGEELAKAFDEGQRNGWKNGEMENVLALLEHQRTVLAQAEQMEQDLTFEMNYKFNLNNLTRGNAQEIFAQEKQLIDEYKEKFMRDRETAKEAAIKELSWTEAAIEDYKKQNKDTKDLEKLAATYRDLIAGYLDPEKAEADWKEKMAESMGNLRQYWIAALKKAGYGIGEAETYEQSTLMQSIGAYRAPGTDLADDLYKASTAYDPIGDATKALQLYFDTIKKEQPDYVQEMMDTMNLNVWDIASNSIKQNLVKVLRDTLGDDYAAAALQGVGIPLDEVELLFGDGFKFDPNDIKPKIQESVDSAMEGVSFKTTTNENNDNPLDIFGLSYKAPENNPISQAVEEAKEQSAEIEVHIVFDHDALKDEVEKAFEDGIISEIEKQNIVDRFGKIAYREMLKELDISFEDGADFGEGGRGAMKPLRTSANSGMVSDVNYTKAPTQPTVTVSAQDNAQSVSNTQQGVQKGTSELLSALNSILEVARQINRKDFSVNITPNSDWGKFSTASGRAYSRITGDQP